MSSTTDIQWRPHGIEGEITVDILSKEDSVEISLIANSRRLSREKAEEFLLGLESIIVGFYSGMDLTISQLKRRLEIERTAGTEFTFTRGGWVDVDNVRKAVLSIRGVKDAAVIADGDEIVARVTVDGEFDHTRSSRAALAAAARLQNAIAPSRWEIIKSDDSTAEEATGAGSEPCDRERSDKIDAISRTFFELNSVRLESLEPSYIEAGGSVAKIPEFIDRMNQRGWFGVAVEDLVGFDALTEVGDRIFRKFEM